MTALPNLAKKIFFKSLESISPYKLVKNALHRKGNILTVNGIDYEMQKNVYVVGFGKAVYGMAVGLQSVIKDHLAQGIISIPSNTLLTNYSSVVSDDLVNMDVLEGAENNLPDRSAVNNAKQIKNLVTSLNADDILIVLISGGGSALLPAPVSEITLEEKLLTIKSVANAGGTIQELNTIRKKLSQLKGGKLTSCCKSENSFSLIISDIVGDPLDLIASGPTVVDTSTYHDCLNILKTLEVDSKIPASVRTFFEKNVGKETDESRFREREILMEHSEKKVLSKTNLLQKNFDQSYSVNTGCNNYIIGSNKILVAAAVEEAQLYDFQAFVLTTTLEGLAEHIGSIIAELAVNIRLRQKDGIKENLFKLCEKYFPFEDLSNQLMQTKNICLITAGETTVNVTGNGKGGRNQHLILSALSRFKELATLNPSLQLKNLCLVSAGSDGQDGPTDVAGALCTDRMIDYVSNNKDIDVNESLRRCASYDFFKSHLDGECFLKTGLTGTNVMDIQMLFLKN